MAVRQGNRQPNRQSGNSGRTPGHRSENSGSDLRRQPENSDRNVGRQPENSGRNSGRQLENSGRNSGRQSENSGRSSKRKRKTSLRHSENESRNRKLLRKRKEAARRKNSKNEISPEERKDRFKGILFITLFSIICIGLVVMIAALTSGDSDSEKETSEAVASGESIPETIASKETADPASEIIIDNMESSSESVTETMPAETAEETVTETTAETVETTVPATTIAETEVPFVLPVTGVPSAPAEPVQGGITIPSWITQDLLTGNKPSRPREAIGEIKNVVIHYVGNTGSSAKDNRDYFEEDTDGRDVSSHFIIGLQGEILQCIPLNEVAHAQASKQINRNYDCISIENCHPGDDGMFNEKTYASLVKLSSWVLQQYGLSIDALIRHYDVTGKACPLYFVEHEEAWIQFKQDVADFMAAHPNVAVEYP